ncbi:exocyst complex component EXO70H1 [Elaeis guineensis]|uniref:Exocyst subunit Exo70 family protein n=1 Tax=Elaeis guineensis var. tenera TaxID=51953 RepID=A0A6I9R964_ELAGV|nr:exocyst complex component EXO70H1 [Elaeis guineensis]
MPRNGLRALFSHAGRWRSNPPSASPRQSFSATLMEDHIASAEAIISRWNADANANTFAKVTSLFHAGRAEAREFLHAVADLQRAMVFFVSGECAAPAAARSAALIRAQTLMQTAMRRLEHEFQQILCTNRDRLDPESVSSSTRTRSRAFSDDTEASDDDEICAAGESIGEVERASAVAMADLRAIAESMIAAGYGKECVRIYKTLRKSIVDEGLYRLGFERLSQSQIHQKLDWEALDLKIRSWLVAAPVALRTLFSGERILCDYVFAGSDSIGESCFADITRDAAALFLEFPESVAKTKRSPEKLFRILDVYDAISDLWPEIEAVFCFESTAAVRSQALASLLKLAEAARAMLADFETAIQKDNSKSPVPGGAVHPLTRYVMNYLAFLADYEASLADIYADFSLQIPTPLPESFFDSASTSASSSSASDGGGAASTISPRFAWLVLVLLCKLDGKAEVYREVALSYLFLSNNLQYIVNKVRESHLRFLLGDDWAAKHAAKARHYASSYERLGWAKVAAAVPADPAAKMDSSEAWEKMKGFNLMFEATCRCQADWVVADARIREEVRASVASLIVPAYRVFYEGCRAALRDSSAAAAAVVRFSPGDVKNRVYGLLESGSFQSPLRSASI